MGHGWRYRACVFALALASGCGAPPGGKLALGLKYVAYRDSRGEPVLQESEARANLGAVNWIWRACDLSFELEEYVAVDPVSYGLRYEPREVSELRDIREAFGERDELLLVTTGPWGRSGSLGESPANAWTAMPSLQGPFGAVLEEKVADFATMIAHELGHYLGLGHVNDTHDVMNPTLYSFSRNLNEGQCKAARASAVLYWPQAIRRD